LYNNTTIHSLLITQSITIGQRPNTYPKRDTNNKIQTGTKALATYQLGK